METVLELIIDYSISMGPYKHNNTDTLLPDGSTRMSLAKKVLVDDIIPALDYTGTISISTFYSKPDSTKQAIPFIDKIYEGEFKKGNVISKIQTLTDPTNTGGTPISAALQASIDNLKNLSGSDRKIILVTDGEETDGGDFRVTAENGLKNYGINYNLFIIGIGQNAETAEKCEKLSNATKGGYVNLQTINYDKNQLSDVLRPLTFKAVGASIVNVQQNNVNAITSIENNKGSIKSDETASNTFNEEILKVIKGQSYTIELLNKQLLNLEKATNSNSERTNRCLEKISEINFDDSNIKLQSIFKNEFSQFEQGSLLISAKVNEKLENINKQIEQIAFVAKDVTRLDQFETNISTLLQSIQKTVVQCKIDIDICLNSISKFESFGLQLKNIQDRIEANNKDQLYIKETLTSINAFVLASMEKQEKRDKNINLVLGILSIVIMTFMAFLFLHKD